METTTPARGAPTTGATGHLTTLGPHSYSAWVWRSSCSLSALRTSGESSKAGGNVPLVFVGLGVISFSLLVWWRQDMSFGMHGEVFEPKSTGTPFQNIDIRKVAMWMFLMSEMMVFTSLFSTNEVQARNSELKTVFHSGEWVEGTAVTCFEPAGHLIASSWFHIAPGAINTFALISPRSR
ncbi:MAG: hypothetical protein Ct9H90mP21_1670 [Methanobacteriota archaeon]|nr:MAG: hypothetical protein Ct9H90mP21_1670 [Euryarchaeota archaeon]